MPAIKPAKQKGKPQDLRRARMFLEAAHQGKVEEIHKLIKTGVDIDTADENGTTALAFAALQGKTAALKLLLEKGADTEKANQSGFTPIQRAAARGHVLALRMLVQRGAKLDHRDHQGQTVLHAAARGGFINAVKEILKQRHKAALDIDARDGYERPALLFAAAANTPGAMMALLDGGANMDLQDKNGLGLMDYVSEKNKPVLLERLSMQQARTVRRAWARNRKHGPAM